MCVCHSLTHRHHIRALTPTGAAERAGGAGHDGLVGLPGVVHHLGQEETLQFRCIPVLGPTHRPVVTGTVSE